MKKSPREANELCEAKVVQLREQEQKLFEQRANELNTKLTQEQERVAAQRQKTKEKNELVKKHKALTHKLRLENVERQVKKDEYRKFLIMKYRNQQNEKMEKISNIRATLRTQGLVLAVFSRGEENKKNWLEII